MVDCLNPIYQNHKQCCGSSDDKVYTDHILTDTSRHGIIWPIIFFTIQGFVYWLFVYGYENNLYKRLKACCLNFRRKNRIVSVTYNDWIFERDGEFTGEDNDVIAEKENVKTMNPYEVAVIVDNIKKWYGNFNAVKGVTFHVKMGECFGLLGVNGAGKTSTFQMLTGENDISDGDAYGNFNAVKGVTFHVKMGECFGLLGVNGAGKTSTFQMLTGENDISDGDAFVNGWSVKTNWRKAGANIGYCPQFDAILKEMTGEETLYMFARIRGIPKTQIPEKVNAVIQTIGIGSYAKRQIKSYSGGNKRRLSLGIALIGLPSVLLLDEPTTGVDPKARRIIWKIFSEIQALGTALVLTSHSMDECEALCTELAIMVDGRFKCYGSCQHIKSRYGAGFTLLIRLRHCEEADRIDKEVLRRFPGAVLKEHHLLQLTYELPKRSDTTWSSLFNKLEDLIRRFDFEDYSLSQTTLEQVFLEFSRNMSILSQVQTPSENNFIKPKLYNDERYVHDSEYYSDAGHSSKIKL
ncbi:ABC transporter, ATP-binding protein [Dictyocaulus viviparus]|uniref:ABC transporter, ATP-binding protein n=1 Tax=Dictyocaulus viviparus TaxID=29172 RepID=A0A0D8XHI3_DICVI|nr:ABC transporter, ATP-binding protein [Dictyocaulus viviparus]